MKVSRLELTDFRNYENQTLDFDGGVNVISGDNAQGKTNILEAIYFFSLGKSNRARRDIEMIRHNQDCAKIIMEFSDNSRKNSVRAEIFRNKRKVITINDVPVRKNSELVRRFNAVYFGPEYMGFVKDGPSVRRKNLDILISQIRPGYISHLGELKKIIDSKNALLRMDSPNVTMLDIMDEKLALISSDIILSRAEYINKLSKIAGEIQSDISNGSEKLDMRYLACVDGADKLKKEEILKILKDKIKESRKREIRLCEAVTGPHRDDIEILINGKEAKLYASQGQQKTVVMSEKLAEVRLLEEETGEIPVLLLDDIMSELDRKRREYILGHIKDMQILITCTDLDDGELSGNSHRFEVKNGVAVKLGEV